jgi:hypothetical protein
MRYLLVVLLIAFSFNGGAQTLDQKLAKATERVYSDYKLFFDSSLLSKYVVLDKNKSYLVNGSTQKIKTIALADDSFVFDEFSLSFAVVYKGDTIRHLPVCRLDTHETLLALGTPSNPVRHGDVLPPYMQLIKGNIKFDYKKLQKQLQKMQLQTTEVNLQAFDAGKEGKTDYRWVVTTSCPDIRCRVIHFSADNGKVVEEINP